MDKNFTNNEELLVRFLDGELTGAEKQSIEQQLTADKQMQEHYDSLLITKESLKQYGLTQKVAAIHQQMMQEMQSPARNITPVKKLIRIGTAIAASIILIIGGFWLYNSQTGVSGDKVFASNYHAYEMVTVRDPSLETNLEKAYRAKNYKEVISIASETEVKSTQALFLTGAAAVEVKDDNRAIKNFTEVLQTNKTSGQAFYNDEAEYYLTLSYIRSGNYSPALDLLKKIKSEPAHKYHQQVTDKLISQVKRLNNK